MADTILPISGIIFRWIETPLNFAICQKKVNLTFLSDCDCEFALQILPNSFIIQLLFLTKKYTLHVNKTLILKGDYGLKQGYL